jgi:hypothetical protein
MPIHFYQKPSLEKLRPGWQTTRFWLSCWSLVVASGTVIWGAWHGQAGVMSAGCASGAAVAAAYVWAISREP